MLDAGSLSVRVKWCDDGGIELTAGLRVVARTGRAADIADVN